MTKDEEKQFTGMIAIGLRLAYAAGGDKPMIPAVRACEEAVRMTEEMKARGILPPVFN